VSAPRQLAADSEDDASPSSPPGDPETARPLSERDVELRRDLESALARTQGNVSEVARSMGKTRMQIHRWMKRFGMSPESFRSA
jgi:transcriptional regulator of acetoin/glycerol metabolism